MQPALMSRGPHPRTRVLCSIHGPDSIWATSWPEAILVHCWTLLSSEETTLFYTYFVLLWDFPLSSSTCFLFPLIFTSLGDSGWENQTDWFIFKMSLLGILNFVLKSLDVLTLWYALFKYFSFWKFYVPGFMKLVFSSVLCFFCFFFNLQVFLCSGVSSVSLSLSPS